MDFWKMFFSKDYVLYVVYSISFSNNTFFAKFLADFRTNVWRALARLLTDV